MSRLHLPFPATVANNVPLIAMIMMGEPFHPLSSSSNLGWLFLHSSFHCWKVLYRLHWSRVWLWVILIDCHCEWIGIIKSYRNLQAIRALKVEVIILCFENVNLLSFLSVVARWFVFSLRGAKRKENSSVRVAKIYIYICFSCAI